MGCIKGMEEKIETLSCRIKSGDDQDIFSLKPHYIDEINDSIIEILENDTKRELLHARIMISKGQEPSLLITVAKCISVMLLVSYERVVQAIKDDIELVSQIRYALGYQDQLFFKQNKEIIFGGELSEYDSIISDEGIRIGQTKRTKKMAKEISRAYLSVSESHALDNSTIDMEGLSQLSSPQASIKQIVSDSYFKRMYEGFFPPQMKIFKEIIKPDKQYTLYLTSGTAGSGKSVLSSCAFMFKLNELYLEAVKNSIPIKTLSVFILGRTLQSIHNTIVPTLVRWFSPLVKSPHRNATYITVGGINISFISLDSSSSIEAIRGSNCNLAYIDEATSMRSSDLTAILTRLRSGIGNFHPQFILSSNYSFRKSVPSQIENNATGLDALVNHIQSGANPYLQDGFMSRLSSSIDKNSIGYKIHVLGQHVDVDSYSNIYNLTERNLIEHTEPLISDLYTSHVYIGVDQGSTNPLVYVALAVYKYFADQNPLCQVVDTLYYPKYHSQYTTREMYDNDLDLFVRRFSDQTKVTIVFPHDAVDKYHHYRRTLSSARVEVIKAKGSDVMRGIAKIKYLLAHDMLQIKDNSDDLINEFHNYSYETKPTDSEFDRNPIEGKPKKTDDHALDALRYAVEASGIMSKIIDKIDDKELFQKKSSEKNILDALTL